MTRNSSDVSNSVSRRKFVVAAGATGLAGLAGCSGTGGSQTPSASGGNDGSDGQTEQTTSSSTSSDSGSVTPLTADGSSTVYPVTNLAGSYWNSNPPADDKEYWGPGQYGIETDKSLADYWAGLYGFEGNDDGTPPFRTSIGLSHSGVGLEKLKKGQVDIGDSSAPVGAEFPDASDDELEPFTDHVVAVDAQPVVVSKEIYDAGVTKLTLEQLQDIYRGEITKWSEIDGYDGPDKEIQAVGRAEGSGTDTAFRLNVLGDPDASMSGVDIRKGQNQQVKTLVSKSNNAVAYLALAFVDEEAVPPVSLEIEGTTYTYGENLGAKEYPLSRDLHAYTWDGTSKKEAAFLRMILTEFGQKNFVATNNYVTLTEKRLSKERSKLPEPEA
ncbi:phosphate ABC transporter substrate-binding protein [Halogeometricum borinquense]|uniref:Phosphate ABC transporter substrate-binding protein n=1 Tax=Halogeometricum borinquense TaxID=60847 RepID=A0A482TFM4_9EURY|nr:substrate-binding domain-containing protein [Halogeometricum borinquense]RYJ15196.1 phosphate ABC transporter substrate-binding protein [Halogeometricum borinquense]